MTSNNMSKKTTTKKLETETSINVKPDVDVNALAEKLEALEKQRVEDQKKIEMLEAVADKGRVFNYQNKTVGKKQMNINLSVYEGKIIVGWRTLKDILIKNPTTGLTVGEEQEYEVLLLNDAGEIEKVTIHGYPRFSEVRYTNRIETRVVGKKEDENGNLTFTVLLPDGREIDLDQRFLN